MIATSPSLRIFITGASSGIGSALAAEYAKQGAVLGLFARRRDELEKLAVQLKPAQCAVYTGDVRNVEHMQASANDFMTRFGAPDIIIANAGISRGTLTEYREDLEVFADVLAINVMGMVHTFYPFIAALRQRHTETGSISKLVGIASIAGFRGLPGSEAYSASKAAAISYLESLRVELRHCGVRVLTVCPGYIATPMTEKNPYPMPFLISAAKAAQLIVRAIARNKRFYVFPWPMVLVGGMLRMMPRVCYDWLFIRAPHKPRA